MKNKIILLCGFLLLSVFASAQEHPGGDQYVFVISRINYLKAIDDAVQESTNQGLNISEARVILCGESVKAFQEQHPIVAKAMKNKRISLYACGLSLEQMKMDRSVLPSGVSSVENGLLEAMVLEKKGYRKFDF